MATNIDRALYTAPEGVDLDEEGGIEVEIEVDVPGDVEVDIGEGEAVR